MPYVIASELRSIIGDALRPGGLTLTERAADYCGFCANDKIIDIGCGFGATLKYLHQNYGSAVYGIDLNVSGFSDGFQFVKADAQELPFAADSFSGILCECVLSLLPLRNKAINEFNRVLQHEGYLIVSDIYLRNPGKAERSTSAGSASCLTGATGREELLEQMRYSGFEVLLWEDCSDALAQLTAKIVWELGSLDMLMNLMLPGSCSSRYKKCLRDSRPGYFLMIAKKWDKTL
ncbi:MAG: class I SAM-dependent methyltransferase [Proteobacteria bacterium]|nr:class I SAM-dependent methyltransferase [Pseudomonadota bacterium]